jgi:phage gp29-like protein
MSKKPQTPGARIKAEKRDLSETPDVNLSGGDHFATRQRVNDFVRLMRALPDPDPVLKKMGRGITALQELLTDSHLESVWTVRCAAASGAEWFTAAGGEGRREQAAADAFGEELKNLDIPRIIEEMMDAVAYGYSPLEILWKTREGKWGIDNIVGKPPQWFEFDQENNLALKTGILGAEKLPPNRFLLVQNRPSYANPYGVKVFSKCFWPVTFKKNGFRWWTVFVEKYGGSFLLGKYPPNSSQQFKDELLEALQKMAADSVAIAPEGAEITIAGAADKQGSSDAHQGYIQTANAEISKAVLGETLTTEIGPAGSYAAAKTHNEVREHIAAADRRRISAAFNRLAAVYTFYNFGPEVTPPRFEFVVDEDLQADRAKRDVDLHKTGWRPRKSYITREYGIPEEDYDLAGESSAEDEGIAGFDRDPIIPRRKHPEGCPCGCQDYKKRSPLIRWLAVLSAGKNIRSLERDKKLMGKFESSLLKEAQEETNETVNTFIDALGLAHGFDEAAGALGAAYDRLDGGRCAALIDNARYAAGQIGARTAKKEGGRRG